MGGSVRSEGSMSSKTIGLGVLLMALGIVVTLITDTGSVTSLIPTFIGVVFLVLGVIAAVREDLRRHVVHAAAALALIAILGSAGSLISRWDGDGGYWAEFSQGVTIALCGLFLVAAIGSFKAARAAGKAAETAARNAAV